VPPVLNRLRRYVGFTRRVIGVHLLPILGLGLIAAAAEGLGILLFIPILMRLVPQGGSASPGRLASTIERWTEGYAIESLLALLVLLFALKGALVFGISVYRSTIFARARERMRVELFDALGRVRIRELHARRLGSMSNLLVGEIEGAGVAMDRLCAAIGAFTSASILFAIAVALNPALSVVLLASGGVSLALLRRFARARMAISREATRAAGSMASLSVEALRAFKYLRATGRFGVLRDGFADATAVRRHVDERAGVVDGFRHSLREPLLVLWIGAVFYLFVVVARQSLGVVTDGILFFYRVSIELGSFQDLWQNFAARVGSLEAYERLRSELDAAREDEEGGTPLRFERELRLERVSFAYDGEPVLRDLDLRIPKRQTVALVGASGAGKSTITDLIAACLEPAQGAVTIDGVDLRSIRRSDYRRSLGYVTQESVVFSGSVARNVTMEWHREPSAVELERAREAARMASCLELIEGLDAGWHTELGEGGVRLSGGERQRIAIARELHAEPQLLILDEATSALDSVSEQAIQTSLELLHGRMTLLIVAHRLSTIRRADIVYVIEDGRVAECGTFDELIARPESRFRALCEMQSLV